MFSTVGYSRTAFQSRWSNSLRTSRTAFFRSAKSMIMPPRWSPSTDTSTWYVCPCRLPHFGCPGRWCAQSMYSVIPTRIGVPLRAAAIKAFLQRCHDEEPERLLPGLHEPVVFARPDEDNVPRGERDLPLHRLDPAP